MVFRTRNNSDRMPKQGNCETGDYVYRYVNLRAGYNPNGWVSRVFRRGMFLQIELTFHVDPWHPWQLKLPVDYDELRGNWDDKKFGGGWFIYD
jgi:hypothetical protein